VAGIPPTVREAVEALSAMTRSTVNADLAKLLDRLDANGRFALLKLATGAMRVGFQRGLRRLQWRRHSGLNSTMSKKSGTQ